MCSLTCVCKHCKAVRPVCINAIKTNPMYIYPVQLANEVPLILLLLLNPLFPSLYPPVSVFLYFLTAHILIISEGVIIIGAPQTAMCGFSLKDRIMRRSIYLQSVMCVSPDIVKRHVDLSLSALVRGEVENHMELCFFSVIFNPSPHSLLLNSLRIPFKQLEVLWSRSYWGSIWIRKSTLIGASTCQS